MACFSSLPPHCFSGVMHAMPKAPPSPRTAKRQRYQERRRQRGSHPMTTMACLRLCDERWVWLGERLLQEYYNVHWWFFTTCRSATRRDLCSLVNLEETEETHPECKPRELRRLVFLGYLLCSRRILLCGRSVLLCSRRLVCLGYLYLQWSCDVI